MRAQKASAPVRFARTAAAVVLVAVAAAVGLYLLKPREVRPPAPLKPPPDGAPVDVKERVRHEEYRDGRLQAAIRGDAFFLGPEGRNHLKGSVEVLDYSPAGKIVARTTAGEVAYDKDGPRFVLSGGVRVEAGDVVLEGETFVYEKNAGIFLTESGGAFASPLMAGRAAGISYREGADEVRLSGGFRVELAAGGGTGEKNVLSGDSLVYSRPGRRGRVEGSPARFSGGRANGSASTVTLVASGDERSFEILEFEGGAELALAGGREEGIDEGEVRADRISVSFGPGASRLASAEARGDVRLSLRSVEAHGTSVMTEGLRLNFGAGERLERWGATGGLRAELEAEGEGPLVLEADMGEYELAARVLRASGAPGRPAAAESARARIEAASIAVGPAAGELEASGGAKCLIKPRAEGGEEGIFTNSGPVFVSCQSLALRPAARAYLFSGEVQAWQERIFLLAGELDYAGETGEMRGRGGAAVGLTRRSAEGGRQRIELGGDAMAYSPSGRALTFTGESYVQFSGARLEAEAIQAVLSRGDAAVDGLTARTGVVLSKDRFEGRGDRAVYLAGSDRISLTGRPVLVEKGGRSTRGDKLTFDLRDDKISVENEGQGRSTTIIKS